MKNTNDLRRLLDELADETPEVPTQEWLAATRQKVRVRRRARVAGVAGAVALVLAAAVAVVPRIVDDASPEPVDPPPKPTDSREWDFPAGTEIDRVLASRANAPGTSELTWRTTLTHPVWDVETAVFCYLPSRPDPGESEVRAVVSINGGQVTTKRCWPSNYPPVNDRMVKYPLISWRGHDVKTGEPFTVAMWLEQDGERVDVSDAEFGAAFYSCGNAYPPRSGRPGGCAVLGIPLRWPDL